MFQFSQDWAKPGPYDQPMVNTLRRKKDKDTSAAVVDSSSGIITNNSNPLSGLASTELQTPIGENIRTVAAPLKVSFNFCFLYSICFYYKSRQTFQSKTMLFIFIHYNNHDLHLFCLLLFLYLFWNSFCLPLALSWINFRDLISIMQISVFGSSVSGFILLYTSLSS